MKPMLAAKFDNFETESKLLRFPLIASPKLDGIRAVIVDGQVMSRTLKPIPNADIQKRFGKTKLNGLDGELIVGAPTAKDCYTQTVSVVMSEDKPAHGADFFVFDRFDMAPQTPYIKRLSSLRPDHETYITHEAVEVHTITELLDYEQLCLDQGYEGLILRDLAGLYKHGRATLKQQWLIKMKRFEDSDATIISTFEEMENQNEKVTNALGRGQRSSHKENLVGKNSLGGFECCDIHTGVTFAVGSGFNAAQRQVYWENRTKLIGKAIKYKFFPVGVKDKPRHPVFLGFRDMKDIG